MQDFPREANVYLKDTRHIKVLFGLCYPSTYRAGMTGLATHLFYSSLNRRPDTSCERYFRFDVPSPFHSIESRRPLRENHIVGFSLTYETDVVHMIQMLELGGVPVWARERTETDPIVIVGGPAVSANPEPFAMFVDAFVIGEGDRVIHDMIEVVMESSSRHHAIDTMAELEGVYVPSRPRSAIRRLVMRNLDEVFHPTRQVVPDVPPGDRHEPVFGRALLVEVTRGCSHSCKFCLVGHICRPRRARSLQTLQNIVSRGLHETPVAKVALIGSSLGDMDQLEELVAFIVSGNHEFSVPSLRADSVTMSLARMLVQSGQRTLTIAPETGSQELRRAIGKGLDDDAIEQAVSIAAEAGIKSVKLYFIIGLPGETHDDVREIPTLVGRLYDISHIRMTVSVNPFVPKAHTRFERYPQPPIEEIRHRLRIVQRGIRDIPQVQMESLDPRLARVQAALSLGDRNMAMVIRLAARYGGLGGWRRAERESGVPFFSVANNGDRLSDELPWSFIQV